MLERIARIATIGRVASWMFALPLLKRLLPLPRLVKLMWVSAEGRPRDRARESALKDAVARVYREGVIPRRHNCLERGLVTYRLLSAAGAEPTLIVGLRAPGAAPTGHAWVLVDGRPVLDDDEDLSDLSPLLIFGSGGALLDAGAAAGDARDVVR